MGPLKEDFEDQADFLMQGGAEVLPEGKSALVKRLKQAHDEKRPLRVKLGIDPTGGDLHLGHTVCLQLLHKFQSLGHIPILLIGGFTAQLGDPSGRNEARPPLNAEQVKTNSATYLAQASKILDLGQSELANNADWLALLTLSEILKLVSTTTINQLIAKDAFGERLEQGHPLFMHEIFYPILQGYDSVILRADIEIGGHDQRFNLLAGRDLQKHSGQEQQLIMMMPLLVGLDGQKKMSKTANNFIAVNDSPSEMYGKTMSLPDALLLSWFALVQGADHDQMKAIGQELKAGTNPRNLKMQLARSIVKQYHGQAASKEAESDFISRFQRRQIPDQIPIYHFQGENLIDLLLASGMVESKGEAKRLVAGQGVQVNSVKAVAEIALREGDIVQIGKRKFLKLVGSPL